MSGDTIKVSNIECLRNPPKSRRRPPSWVQQWTRRAWTALRWSPDAWPTSHLLHPGVVPFAAKLADRAWIAANNCLELAALGGVNYDRPCPLEKQTAIKEAFREFGCSRILTNQTHEFRPPAVTSVAPASRRYRIRGVRSRFRNRASQFSNPASQFSNRASRLRQTTHRHRIRNRRRFQDRRKEA